MPVLVPRIFIPCLVKGQPRPRAFARNGKARVYDSGTAEGFKGAIALAVRPFIPAVPAEGPVALSLVCVFPRPKSHYTKKGLRPFSPEFHTSKPDSDNVLKAVCDALTGVGLWKDDAQVASVEVRKEYGAAPGCSLKVEMLTGSGAPA